MRDPHCIFKQHIFNEKTRHSHKRLSHHNYYYLKISHGNIQLLFNPQALLLKSIYEHAFFFS